MLTAHFTFQAPAAAKLNLQTHARLIALVSLITTAFQPMIGKNS
jgi:hypothetical protein